MKEGGVMSSFAGGRCTGSGRAWGDGCGSSGTGAVAVVVGEGMITSWDHYRRAKTLRAMKYPSNTSTKMRSMMTSSML